MQKKFKILVSAYACSPNRGSEPGMGWNFVVGLSEYHEVHVISEKIKWKQEVLDALEENPKLRKNLRFYFIEKKRNKTLRKIWPPSYYWYYKKWQQKAYRLALTLNLKENFDIIHQLNMVGYREPGYLWKIDRPFVWGPIGGLRNSPWAFLFPLGLKGMLYFFSRNIINFWQRNFSARPKKAANRHNSILITATFDDKELAAKLWKKDSIVICEVGQVENFENNYPIPKRINEPLNIVWSGQHTSGKNLPLLLHALNIVKFPFVLHILGTGAMTKKWKMLANSLGLNIHCRWYGWVERNLAIDVMKNGHVFCITSIKDLTATVTLESLSFGIPIVCLDHCGFSHVVTEDCGIKIPVNSPAKAALNFAKALSKLYYDENYRQQLSKGGLSRSKIFSWGNKIDRLNEIYNSLIIKIN